MLYREIIAIYSEIHTKHINTLCGQNVEFVNVGKQAIVAARWLTESIRAVRSKDRMPAEWDFPSRPDQLRGSHWLLYNVYR